MSEHRARATAIVRKPAVKAERVADRIALDHEARERTVGALTGERGVTFEVRLDREAVLNDGDAFKLEDGRLVEIRAAPEDLLEIRAENPARLMGLAWQLGGWHAPAEIGADAIYVPEHAALAELARGQGCTATPVRRPFSPARAAGHDCGHDHHDGHHHHGHSHDLHGHDHG